MACIQFNSNMKTMHSHFNDLTIYLNATLKTMAAFKKIREASSSIRTSAYHQFSNILHQQFDKLTNLKRKIAAITSYSFSLGKIAELGPIMSCFYELHTNPDISESILYSFGFNRYALSLYTMKEHVKNGYLSFALFDDGEKKKGKKQIKTKLKNSYYAPLKLKTPIKNDVKMGKSLILTGPNAAGKTTMLKSTLINVIMSQQFGVGCFGNGTIIVPYKFIHCYLNIPDTSGRDSLFQAEARRCKEIIDSINQEGEKGARHLCGFDELYSGTNPEEAVESATALMLYLGKNKKVTCVLTTHFLELCKMLELDSKQRSQNYRMKVENTDGNLKYTYKMEKGISNVKGGMAILREMGYPDEIIT